MTLEEKRKYAKEKLGLHQAYNMSEETLDAKMAECNQKLVETRDEAPRKQTINGEVKLVIDDNGKEYLDSVDFPYETLQARAKELRFDKLEYSNKHRAFMCYRNKNVIDWLDIGGF